MSASLDVGSIGGLNARLYAGYAMGINTASSLLVRNSAYADGKAQSSEIPYIGLGFSFLDFLNLVPETKREWKDYEYSSWNVGLLQIGLISSGADTSAFTSTTNAAFSGLSLRLMNASVALPILDYKLYAGTSLASMLILGKNEWGLSIMPIRFGYWQPVIEDELTIEPFLEINYYPSSYLNFGGRLNLRLNDLLNLSLMLGYADGNSGTNVGKDLGNNLGVNKNFSRFYFGIGVGLADFILFPQDLRYNKFK
jgi:hypothetical protein